jgi:hypothetical protein
LGGERAEQPKANGNEPMLGGNRKLPTLQEVIAGTGLRLTGPIMVAGVTFDGRQEIIKSMIGGELAYIVPEPDNPHDANALAVHVTTKDGIKPAGYVPRDLAARLAPVLAGRSVRVMVKQVTGRGYSGIFQGLRIE